MDLPITPVTQDSGHGDPPPKHPPTEVPAFVEPTEESDK